MTYAAFSYHMADGQNKSLFLELKSSSLLPDLSAFAILRYLCLLRLRFVIIAAGSETAGRTLTVATYFILSNPRVLSTLTIELRYAMPLPYDKPKLKELEQLPWLVSQPLAVVVQQLQIISLKKLLCNLLRRKYPGAVIKESIRILASVTSRLPQISPHEPLQFQDLTIPPGVSKNPVPTNSIR